ncbi:hypothetical protein SAMN05421806_103500 [Streptomyces indicus]|uniref:Uncharacterized protein n=2 Tax=Streptomyces indicus TaxID=417292 RepID=A0A1G8Y1T2_9ACTN|nr:hypothetical protein SAMN05421806_103500 [Streptomyces indicus]
MPGPESEAPSDDDRVQAEAAAPPAQAPDPDEPRPLGVARTATGHAEVDAQLERLGDVDHLATDGHIEVYEDVHAGLRDTLTALDARQGPPPPGPRPIPGGAPARPYDHRS